VPANTVTKTYNLSVREHKIQQQLWEKERETDRGRATLDSLIRRSAAEILRKSDKGSLDDSPSQFKAADIPTCDKQNIM